MTQSNPKPPKQDPERMPATKNRHAAKHAQKSQEMQQKQMAALMQQKREQAAFNVQVRIMQALESIAESLFAANEEEILAFRKRIEEENLAEAEKARLAEMAAQDKPIEDAVGAAPDAVEPAPDVDEQVPPAM